MNPDKNRTRIIAMAIASLLLTSPLGWSQSQTKGRAVRVAVSRPKRTNLNRELRVPASLVADEQVDLFSKVSGYVADVSVDIGSRVKRGDVLVKLSVPEMADELRRAEAILQAKQATVRALSAKATQAERMVETARARVQRYAAQYALDKLNLERKQALRKGEAIPQQALDVALNAFSIAEAELSIANAQVAGASAEKQADEAAVEVARADLGVAEADLGKLKTLMGYASIRAPFDGTVTMRHVDHGAFVRSAAEGVTLPLLRVIKTDRIRVALNIPEVDASYVRAGTRVQVVVRAISNDVITATITRSAEALDPMTRTMRVEVDLANPTGRLTPGMYANVTVLLDSKEQAMVVPARAIHWDDDARFVYVSDNGIAKSIPVSIGYDDGIQTEILSGLTGSEQIIVASGGSLSPGVRVVANKLAP